MTFAQALARIEELQREVEKLPLYTWSDDCEELSGLLFDHADDIVQLGNVAAEMRRHCIAYAEEAIDAFETYDQLMKGDGDE